MTPIFEYIKENAKIKPDQDWVHESYKGSERLILKDQTPEARDFTLGRLLEIMIRTYGGTNGGTITIFHHKSDTSFTYPDPQHLPLADPQLFEKLIKIVESVP